ncbi:cytochrome P450 [Synechococcus sp. CBW1004]|uniref:cytochrome P450 n=1 Tax=Synechococcus sp. CBW1004 TaxID=1353136 RepID=UPI0018CF553F|nr:cytochrome P450 [Synechococcus sp. CBW1004]QPN64724.1 cytochrome P450 [Synechococcus sp. CBW1004]
MAEPVLLSPEDRRAFQADPCLPGHPYPYPIYAALRRECPVQWCEGPGMWLVLGHPEAAAHMRDPRCLRRAHLDKLVEKFGSGRIFARQKLDIPYMDGEPHASVRKHVMAAYHGIDLQALAAFCEAFIAERLDRLPTGEWHDLMPSCAHPLPVAVTSELMGVPAHQQQDVLRHVGQFVRARGLSQNEETAHGGDQAMEVYRRYFLPLLHERRLHPRDDLLSRLLVDKEQGLALTDEQLLLFVSSNFYSASIYTVPLLISSMALIFSRQPAVFERLRQDPSLLECAVEEALRFDPPAQALNASVASETLEIAGQRIAAGDSLTALVGAANRDPRVFEDPDRFLVDRMPNPHLSFAPGLHQCLGLQLARLEARAVLRAWLERYERVEVDELASRRLVADRFRGFERLVVRFS